MLHLERRFYYAPSAQDWDAVGIAIREGRAQFKHEQVRREGLNYPLRR